MAPRSAPVQADRAASVGPNLSDRRLWPSGSRAQPWSLFAFFLSTQKEGPRRRGARRDDSSNNRKRYGKERDLNRKPPNSRNGLRPVLKERNREGKGFWRSCGWVQGGLVLAAVLVTSRKPSAGKNLSSLSKGGFDPRRRPFESCLSLQAITIVLCFGKAAQQPGRA